MSIPEAAAATRRSAILRALRTYRKRLARRLEALRADLAEAARGPEFRKYGETLLAYFAQVPKRADSVTLPDPAVPERNLEIALDPKLRPQANAQRYFKRATKAERALEELPPRIAEAEAELRELDAVLERAAQFEERAPRVDARVSPDQVDSVVEHERDPGIEQAIEHAHAKLPVKLRVDAWAPAARVAREPAGEGMPAFDLSRGGGPKGSGGKPGPRAVAAAVARGESRAPSERLAPRRFKTAEGWDVLIGKNNEGNDYLTHMMARPEDYWFHVHGAAGSHVVLRRGKGKDEPSRATVLEVASWAAFFSQAKTAGTVPVIYTQKKYVRRPKKAPPGLAVCEREKVVMVKPREPGGGTS
jgi:predicted ribosome quality control (RQC) complex YloA/Tae2 family protein